MIEYTVHPPALTPQLAAHLRELGYDASTMGRRLWAAHSTAADPTEERLVLGGVIAAWRREHPDARINPADYELPPDAGGYQVTVARAHAAGDDVRMQSGCAVVKREPR